MSPTTRKWVHLSLAAFFSLHIPAAVALYFYDLELFDKVGIIYLVLVSQWAIVGTHLAGASAELPSEGDKS